MTLTWNNTNLGSMMKIVGGLVTAAYPDGCQTDTSDNLYTDDTPVHSRTDKTITIISSCANLGVDGTTKEVYYRILDTTQKKIIYNDGVSDAYTKPWVGVKLELTFDR